MGNQALEDCTTGGLNTAVGHDCMRDITTGSNNTAFGHGALDASTTGSYNTAVGEGCMGALSGSAGANTAVGRYAMQAATTGSNNTCVGADAGQSISTGNNNVCIGLDAGRSNSPGGNLTSVSNRIVLGNDSTNALFCADTSISSSDSRDKTDITDFSIGLNWIKELRPVTYRWDKRSWYGTGVEGASDEFLGTPDGSKKASKINIGFLAQEVLAVEKANGYGDTNDNMLVCNLTDDETRYGLKYERLVPVLVNAIKELSVKNDALEARLAALEGS